MSKDFDFWDGLLLLFIGLKIGGAISWAWFWVLSPLWIRIALHLLVAMAGEE